MRVEVFAGETDVPLFVTYVDSVFAGATTDMVQLRYTWAVDTAVTDVKSDDKYGVFKVISQTPLILNNTENTVTLTQDSTVDLMGNLKFRVADSTTTRYYPKVDYEILGEGVTPGVTPAETTPAKPAATPKEPGFEAVFAIAGLFAVAYLVLRRK